MNMKVNMQKTAHCNAASWSSYLLSESNKITLVIKRNQFLILYFPVIMAELSQRMRFRFHASLCVHQQNISDFEHGIFICNYTENA